jgi:hypothetical protein
MISRHPIPLSSNLHHRARTKRTLSCSSPGWRLHLASRYMFPQYHIGDDGRMFVIIKCRFGHGASTRSHSLEGSQELVKVGHTNLARRKSNRQVLYSKNTDQNLHEMDTVRSKMGREDFDLPKGRPVTFGTMASIPNSRDDLCRTLQMCRSAKTKPNPGFNSLWARTSVPTRY